MAMWNQDTLVPMRPVLQGIDYSSCTIGKMMSPCCQPLRYQVTDEPGTEGEQLTFLVRPENFCCGMPFCLDRRSIDIHRITKDGTVIIEKYGAYIDRQVIYRDVVKVEFSPSQNAETRIMNYVTSTAQYNAIESVANNILIDSKNAVQDRVNQFLEERRREIGNVNARPSELRADERTAATVTTTPTPNMAPSTIEANASMYSNHEQANPIYGSHMTHTNQAEVSLAHSNNYREW